MELARSLLMSEAEGRVWNAGQQITCVLWEVRTLGGLGQDAASQEPLWLPHARTRTRLCSNRSLGQECKRCLSGAQGAPSLLKMFQSKCPVVLVGVFYCFVCI